MSLGGLALAVGMLVDDATVEIENTHRNLGLEQNKPLASAIHDSADQFVGADAELDNDDLHCVRAGDLAFGFGEVHLYAAGTERCVGADRFLRAFANVGADDDALPPAEGGPSVSRSRKGVAAEPEPDLALPPEVREGFDWFANKYHGGLEWALGHRAITLTMFAAVCLGSLALVPVIGRDFFPYVDSGQMEFHVRPPAGTRIETAQEVFKRVNEEIRRVIPPAQLQMVVNNIGLPPGGINLAYSASDTTSNGDGDVLVLLAAKHRPTQEWMKVLREDFAQKFPEDTFFFEPADITNQTLNFGLPAPIDVQVRGKDAAITAQICRITAAANQECARCGGRVHAAGGQRSQTQYQGRSPEGAGVCAHRKRRCRQRVAVAFG